MDGKDFILQRQNINIENSTRAALGQRALVAVSPGSTDTDSNSSEGLAPPNNLMIVPGSKVAVVQADGTTRISLVLQWDDVSGADDYEVWQSEEQA